MLLSPPRWVLCLAILFVLAAPASAQLPELPGAAAEPEAEAPQAPVELESPDAEIEQRLKGLFGEIEGLEGVQVEVRDGVVSLTGSVLTPAEKRRAEDIAGRLAGVVSVENELVTEHRVTRRLQPLVEGGRNWLRDAANFAPLVVVAVIVFAAFWIAGVLLTRLVLGFRRFAPNAFIASLIRQVVRLVFILAGLVAAMSILGATAILTSLLGAAGLFGLAVGFAVRDTIENYIASILLSVRQPFAPNDHVLIEGHEGHVTLLNSRATFLTTFDGNEVRIPNSTVYKAIITNFTRMPERRFEFEVGVGYENPLSDALALALQAAKGVPGVLSEPPPMVVADRLDPYAVAIKVFGWVDQSASDYFKVKSETIRTVKSAFEDAGISMPEPIQNVRQLPAPPEPEAAPTRPARERAPAGAAELSAISDTRADRIIEGKVRKIRSEGEEDFLDPKSPRG